MQINNEEKLRHFIYSMKRNVFKWILIGLCYDSVIYFAFIGYPRFNIIYFVCGVFLLCYISYVCFIQPIYTFNKFLKVAINEIKQSEDNLIITTIGSQILFKNIDPKVYKIMKNHIKIRESIEHPLSFKHKNREGLITNQIFVYPMTFTDNKKITKLYFIDDVLNEDCNPLNFFQSENVGKLQN